MLGVSIWHTPAHFLGVQVPENHIFPNFTYVSGELKRLGPKSLTALTVLCTLWDSLLPGLATENAGAGKHGCSTETSGFGFIQGLSIGIGVFLVSRVCKVL